jgi:hypothetical protein
VKRHTILLFGLLIFFVGIQFRMVESFTLSDFSSRLIEVAPAPVENVATPSWSRKVVEPPRWLGLALMSVGSVLTLRSMKPPKVSFGAKWD